MTRKKKRRDPDGKCKMDVLYELHRMSLDKGPCRGCYWCHHPMSAFCKDPAANDGCTKHLHAHWQLKKDSETQRAAYLLKLNADATIRAAIAQYRFNIAQQQLTQGQLDG